MAEKATTERSAPEKRPPAARPRRFTAPDELKAEFGVQSQTENHIQGVVTTENVRDLLDSFGLQDKSEIVFPFQHMKKANGEVWGIRIEPPAVQTLDRNIVLGHQWVYMKHHPEGAPAGN